MSGNRGLPGYGAAMMIATMLGVTALFTHAARAQTGFNGTITFRSYSGGKPSTMVQTTKGHLLRFESGPSDGNARGTMLIDGNTHTTTILIPEKKQYMQITPGDVQGPAAALAAAAAAAAMRAKSENQPTATQLSIVNTGRTETVAGVKCDVYHGSGITHGQRSEGEFCVADGVGFAMLDMGINGGMMGMRSPVSDTPELAALRDILKGNRGILKMSEVKNGQNVTTLEAINIDRTTPSDAAFAIPPGYTKFEMPKFPHPHI